MPPLPAALLFVLCLSGLAVEGAPPKKFKSEIMCEEYAKAVFTWETVSLLPGAKKEKVDHCVISEPLIVGGELAEPKEFPHMVLLGYLDEDGKDYWDCGGTLISDRWIVTAAHCFKEKRASRRAIVGDLRLGDKTDDAEDVLAEVAEVVVHPSYSPARVYHDLALVRLHPPLALSPYARPACLHRARPLNASHLVASGWGHTEHDGEPTRDLMKVKLPVVAAEKCTAIFKNPKVNKGILDESMICAGGVKGKDTCQGDSGGPLVKPLKSPYCMYSLVGVTSFGAECGAEGKPAVYTRVSHYASWIESIVWPNATT